MEKEIWTLLKDNADWIERQGGAKKGFIKKASVEWRRQRNNYVKKYSTTDEFEMALPLDSVKHHIGYKVQNFEEHIDVQNFARRVVSEIKRLVYDYGLEYESEPTVPLILLAPPRNKLNGELRYPFTWLGKEEKRFMKDNPDNRVVKKLSKEMRMVEKEIR